MFLSWSDDVHVLFFENIFSCCFRIFNFIIFQAPTLSKCIESAYRYLVCTTHPTSLSQSFLKLACFCHGLKMCMCFEYHTESNFFSQFFFFFIIIFTLVIFQAPTQSKCIDSGAPCVCNSIHTLMPSFLKICKFFHR